MTSEKKSADHHNQSFVFTQENLAKAEIALSKYPATRKASAVMPLLDLAQRQNKGWLSPETICYVAGYLEMPEIRVWEVASFYSLYNLTPIGRYHVQICTTTPCWLRGSDNIMLMCQKFLGVDSESTTTDGQFTLNAVECLGACANAPVVAIGDDYYEDLDEGAVCQILETLAGGKKPQARSTIEHTASESDVAHLKEK